MSEYKSNPFQSVLQYIRLRSELDNQADPSLVEDTQVSLADMRSKSFSVSLFAALWDIQVRFPILLPLVAFSVVIKYIF